MNNILILSQDNLYLAKKMQSGSCTFNANPKFLWNRSPMNLI